MNKGIEQEEAVKRQLKTLVERSEKANNEELVKLTEAMAGLLKEVTGLLKEWNARWKSK